ncbi:MAG: substrate-binding domain-containing protein [Oscillospiraceae bacterium]|nr:substrate-binding domain-containing protein [Oscillospiraceae bacterium]
MKTRKIAQAMTALTLTAAMFTGCTGTNTSITVISREDGSGTRDAFTELMGILVDDTDNTVATAEISNSTSVVMQSVVGNRNAIGYISLGSLNDEVKAVSVDGVAATAENIVNGTYNVSRPFNIATKESISELAADFVDYILSADGQAIIEEEGYISVSDAEAYTPAGLTGTIVIAGSTSVAPVMEVLADEYKALNEGVTIEIQQTGSSAGMTSTIEGACDIGMASRDVKDSEIAEGLIPTIIAMDGIAVIVNHENAVENLTSEQIRGIYTGEITDWSEIQ